MYTFIVNPHAKSGLGGRVWEQTEGILKEKGVSYRSFFTKYQRHATQIVRELTADQGEHRIVVLGGDGTVNEVLNGIQDLSRVILGYIPVGSGNDFARYFHHPSDPVQALERILNPGKIAEMNVGVLSYRQGERRKRYGVSAGMGFDAGVCHQAVISKLKVVLNRLRLGKLTYTGVALSQMAALRPGWIRVSLDGKEPVIHEKAYFAAAMNHPYEGGGFKFCPGADPCDGILDVTVIAGLPKWLVLLLLPTAFWGLHVKFRGIYTYTCREAVFESERPLPLHTDGEPVFLQRAVQVGLEPETIRLIAG